MDSFFQNKLMYVDDLSFCCQAENSLCLINFIEREISLNQIYEGKEFLIHRLSDFSNKNQNVCILFSKFSLFELPSKLGAFVLDNGVLLGLAEQGKILENNLIDVFETSKGRLGILIFEDVYSDNIFYYLESLGVDLVIVFCETEDMQTISNQKLNIPCAFLVKDKILFYKM